MTKIIRNSEVYMEIDGDRIYICQVLPGRNNTTRERWSMMHTTPVDIDVPMRLAEVPIRIRYAARAHFTKLKEGRS